MKKYFAIIATISLVMLFASCNKDNKGDDKHILLSVNGVDYTIDFLSEDTVDLLSLSTEFAAEVSVSNFGNFKKLTVNGIQLHNGTGDIPVSLISKDNYLTLYWERKKDNGKIMLRTLHSHIPVHTVSGTSTSAGNFYLSYVFLRLIEKVDNNGNLLFYRFEPHVPESDIDNTGWWDFKKHVINGVTYYSYHSNDPAFDSRKISGFNPGKRVIMNSHYRPIKTIHLKASKDGTVSAGEPVDGHDFYMYGLNHYIVSSYIQRQLESGRTVYAAYLQEVENGAVVFDWWSSSHSEMETWGDPIYGTPDDYVHYNSIDILPDGNWLCSFRHLSSVLIIDRVNKTGNILQRFSGVNNNVHHFHGQHYVRYNSTQGTLSLFNNGNDVESTSLLKFNINSNGEATGCSELVSDGYYTRACGSLTFSGNNTIAGWGIPGSTTQNDRILTEYDAAGNEIFGLRWSSNNTANTFLATYRCVKM
jgi:hypothetical protein